MRKPAFYKCENKGADADQLRGNRTADQCLGFPFIDNTIPLLSKYTIIIAAVKPLTVQPSLSQSSVAVQSSLCRTW